MFQRKELARLRVQKEQLILQSDANRQQLLSDWQRVRSSDIWLAEILGLTRRHPLWVLTLAAAAGTFTAKALRQPRTFTKRAVQAGKLVSMAFSTWKLFRRRRPRK